MDCKHHLPSTLRRILSINCSYVLYTIESQRRALSSNYALRHSHSLTNAPQRSPRTQRLFTRRAINSTLRLLSTSTIVMAHSIGTTLYSEGPGFRFSRDHSVPSSLEYKTTSSDRSLQFYAPIALRPSPPLLPSRLLETTTSSITHPWQRLRAGLSHVFALFLTHT